MTTTGGGKVVVGYLQQHEIAASFVDSLLDLLAWDLRHERRIYEGGGRISGYAGTMRVPEGRNMLCQQFLDTHQAEWLFMVDDDMGFLPDTVERLIDAADVDERPVVGGLCYGQKLVGNDAFHTPISEVFPTIYQFTEVGGQPGFVVQHDFPDDTILKCAATGAACLLIHRSVLQKMRDEQGPEWFTPVMLNGTAMGEDMSFCVRLAQSGFPLHVHTGVETTHQKVTYLRKDSPKVSEPAYVVIPAKDRHDMTVRLVEQVASQAERVFLFDNGSDPPFGSHLDNVEVVSAVGMGLHGMWNAGLDLAAKHADGRHHNVAILNNDVEVPGDFVAMLANALRSREDVAIAYPNHHPELADMPRGGVSVTSGQGGRTLSGWAFMVRGEDRWRFDEQFEWWCGDDDLQAQVEAANRTVVAVGVEHRHLEPNKSTESSPQRQAMARRDLKRFAAKWPALAELRKQAEKRAKRGAA